MPHKDEILKILQNKYDAGLPEDECYVEGYVYVLSLHPIDVFNMNLGGVRKILPMHVAMFPNKTRQRHGYKDELVIREIRNGKILKKEIPEIVAHKPKLKLFLTKEDCINSYQKDLTITNKMITDLQNSLSELKEELCSAVDF